MSRHDSIARSIILAIRNGAKKRGRSILSLIFVVFSSILSFYQTRLQKIHPVLFANLRRNHWGVNDDVYLDSFAEDNGLNSIGDLGLSGSTFYVTDDQKYLVKSVPRHSEHSFFRDDLLTPYVRHMESYTDSMLVRIFDFLGPRGPSIGRALRLVPSHHIVMENIMRGKDQPEQQGWGETSWRKWDLKPTSYFYPERDIADGRLASRSTMSQLADEFQGKIVLNREQSTRFLASLEQDTKLLADNNAVDYSLFLVRITPQNGIPQRQERAPESSTSDATSRVASLSIPEPQSWRTGISSADGKHVFRAVILDFFWAKHMSRPKLMTLLINTSNLFGGHGPMSITTTPEEYRERFMNMCRDALEVRDC